jgi:hypothetical protein
MAPPKAITLFTEPPLRVKSDIRLPAGVLIHIKRTIHRMTTNFQRRAPEGHLFSGKSSKKISREYLARDWIDKIGETFTVADAPFLPYCARRCRPAST